MKFPGESKKKKTIKIDQSKNQIVQFRTDVDLSNWYTVNDEQRNRLIIKLVKNLMNMYFPTQMDNQDKIEFFTFFILDNISLIHSKQFDKFKTLLQQQLFEFR